ncbi:MAG: peptidylprolyl isomerase [Chitinophagales bacterium]
MNKRWLVTIIACCMVITASAQTLFTYGKYTADAKEFIRAYTKNNTQPSANKAKAIKDYLDLYIKSKLKIREAYDRGYDTLQQLKSEVDNLRSQIIENYMTDPQTADRLVNEAFQRSLKDIHVAHIFISFKNAAGAIDTVAAQNKLNDILKRLQHGDDFLTVAQQSSDDPSAKNNKGDIGYITVFTLPYQLENVAYSTPAGKYSAPYRSKAGYHIIKNISERNAAGKMKAQQILLALPPGADETTKKNIAQRADSLYQRIMAGDDFGKLASAFSNDYLTAVNGGNIPDFTVGKYDPAFEDLVWALPKDGSVSAPFVTDHGYHIVKRISINPVITDPKNKTNMQALRDQAMSDSRWLASGEVVFNHVLKVAGFKKFPYNEAVLLALTDSLVDRKQLGIGKKMERTAPLFKIGDTTITVSQWINYDETYRYKPDGSGVKPYDQVMDEFIHAAALQYYRDHLETFNDEFRYQMNEFRDGNLFFEIMQREIWNKSQADSAGLVALFEKNHAKYTWKQSADAIIFFCSYQGVSKLVYDEVKKDPAKWQTALEPYTEKVIGDSARYEWSQIPSSAKTDFKPGMLTTPLMNNSDNTASFAYIIKVYPHPMLRTFAEAKGLVVNDYQTQLEEKWVAELKKKYPVVINQKVLASISK